jgi:hypothetical protein
MFSAYNMILSGNMLSDNIMIRADKIMLSNNMFSDNMLSYFFENFTHSVFAMRNKFLQADEIVDTVLELMAAGIKVVRNKDPAQKVSSNQRRHSNTSLFIDR